MVKGGKNKKNIYIYEAGNFVTVEWRGRSENALGHFKCELLHSNNILFTKDKLKFLAILSVLNLIDLKKSSWLIQLILLV